MTAPLVSIILAAYQSNPEHLLEAVDSALQQTWPEIELLVFDDSPTNQLRKILSSRSDKRLYYHHNIPPLGVAKNHWNAFDKANGEFIVILNHDDRLEPAFVSTLLAELQSYPDSVLAFCDNWIIDVNGNYQVSETDYNTLVYGRTGLMSGMHKPFTNLLISHSIPMAMGSLFRRSALPFVLTSQCGPAYDLWLTYILAKTGCGACYVPQRLSSWRNHKANLTAGCGLSLLKGQASCWHAMFKDLAFSEYRTATQAKAADCYVACALGSIRDGDRFACIRFAFNSLQIRFTLRGLILLLVFPMIPIALMNAVLAQRKQ